jgi:hypothetical protein
MRAAWTWPLIPAALATGSAESSSQVQTAVARDRVSPIRDTPSGSAVCSCLPGVDVQVPAGYGRPRHGSRSAAGGGCAVLSVRRWWLPWFSGWLWLVQPRFPSGNVEAWGQHMRCCVHAESGVTSVSGIRGGQRGCAISGVSCVAHVMTAIGWLPL